MLIYKIIDGQFAHKDCYLEVVMDDMAFSAYTSPRIRQKSTKLEDIGDAMVRELEFSKITLRLREHGEDGEDGDGLIGKLVGNTMETLKNCLVSERLPLVRFGTNQNRTIRLYSKLKGIRKALSQLRSRSA